MAGLHHTMTSLIYLPPPISATELIASQPWTKQCQHHSFSFVLRIRIHQQVRSMTLHLLFTTANNINIGIYSLYLADSHLLSTTTNNVNSIYSLLSCILEQGVQYHIYQLPMSTIISTAYPPVHSTSNEYGITTTKRPCKTSQTFWIIESVTQRRTPQFYQCCYGQVICFS